MLEAFAEMVAEVFTPLLARIRRHELTMWIVLIALLSALFIIGILRFGLGGG